MLRCQQNADRTQNIADKLQRPGIATRLATVAAATRAVTTTTIIAITTDERHCLHRCWSNKYRMVGNSNSPRPDSQNKSHSLRSHRTGLHKGSQAQTARKAKSRFPQHPLNKTATVRKNPKSHLRFIVSIPIQYYPFSPYSRIKKGSADHPWKISDQENPKNQRKTADSSYFIGKSAKLIGRGPKFI